MILSSQFLLLFCFIVSFRSILRRNFLQNPHNCLFLTGFIFYMLFFPALISLGVSSRASYDPNVFLYSVVISTIGLFSYLCAYGYFLPRRKVYNYNHDFNRIGLSKFLINKFRIWLLFFHLDCIKCGFTFLVICSLYKLGFGRNFINVFQFKEANKWISGEILLIFLLVIVLIMSINQTGGRRDILAIFIIWGYIFFNFFRPSSNKDILGVIRVLLFISLLVVTINRSFDLTEGVFSLCTGCISLMKGL